MEKSPNQFTDVLIIGAGMSGMAAASELSRAGLRVMVVDKGRAVGGRMASRRIGEAVFDHGAQFITARSDRFSHRMQEWCAQGAVREWCRGFSAEANGHPRWRGNPDMTALPHARRALPRHRPLLVRTIFEQITAINKERGLTILLVEQNANLALQISHYGYVLETGRVLLQDTAPALRANPQVREAYLGG